MLLGPKISGAPRLLGARCGEIVRAGCSATRRASAQSANRARRSSQIPRAAASRLAPRDLPHHEAVSLAAHRDRSSSAASACASRRARRHAVACRARRIHAPLSARRWRAPAGLARSVRNLGGSGHADHDMFFLYARVSRQPATEAGTDRDEPSQRVPLGAEIARPRWIPCGTIVALRGAQGHPHVDTHLHARPSVARRRLSGCALGIAGLAMPSPTSACGGFFCSNSRRSVGENIVFSVERTARSRRMCGSLSGPSEQFVDRRRRAPTISVGATPLFRQLDQRRGPSSR